MKTGFARYLNRAVTKWRRGRERTKRLTAAPTPKPMPAEMRSSAPGVSEPTT